LKFWGDPGEHTKEELVELHHMLEQFEKEHNTNGREYDLAIK